MKNKKPNILVFCTDQQRADLLGCLGSNIKTPNLDKFAKEGVLLKNVYVQGTVCMSSRSSIFTGKYPSRHGVTDNGYNLPYSETTIADILQQENYHTAAIGRTHIRCSRPHPIHPSKDYYGFKECVHSQCYWTGLDPNGEYNNWIKKNYPDRYDEATTPKPINRKDAYSASWNTLEDDKTMTAWTIDESLKFLDRQNNNSKPFFLWTGTWDPHNRFYVPEPWQSMYNSTDIPDPIKNENELNKLPPFYKKLAMTKWKESETPLNLAIKNSLALYWGTISHIDDQFGILINGLKESGTYDNTIILFISDHGEMAGDHWVWHKGPYFFDGSLKVPAIINFPGCQNKNIKSDALIETIDFLPTLLDLAEIEKPKDIQGKSFINVLEQKNKIHRKDVFSEYQGHIHHEDYTISIFDGTYRITKYLGQPFGELFDLKNDSNALNNLWDDHKYIDIKNTMLEKLHNRIMENNIRADTREDLW